MTRSSGIIAERGEDPAQFIVDGALRIDGARHGGAELRLVLVVHARGRGPDRVDGEAELRSHLVMGARSLAPVEAALQHMEAPRLLRARARVLRAELGERVLQEREREAALVEALGGASVRRIDSIAALGQRLIEALEGPTAAVLLDLLWSRCLVR